MNKIVAQAAQVIGMVTVVVALFLLVWTVADISGSNNFGGGGASSVSLYLSAITQSAGYAVSGMLAIALGMLLEKLDA